MVQRDERVVSVLTHHHGVSLTERASSNILSADSNIKACDNNNLKFTNQFLKFLLNLI